jgi:hypothetical protein
MTISQATKFLEDAFDVLNKEYFESTLTKPLITIQSTPGTFGHYTTYDAWTAPRQGKGFREINLGAESLGRPTANVIATLVHEMTHMYCDQNGIKDTSRNGTYHNSRFKQEAEKRGLSIEYDKRIGWSITQPTKELRSLCARQHWNGKLTAHRSWTPKDPKEPKPSSTRKYICPCCGNSVRATKAVNIICGDCQETMQTA